MMTFPQTDQFPSVSGTENAFPVAIADSGELLIHHGLTKREYFAAMAMQGMLASESNDFNYGHRMEVSRLAVQQADYLIEALNLTAQNPHSDRT